MIAFRSNSGAGTGHFTPGGTELRRKHLLGETRCRNFSYDDFGATQNRVIYQSHDGYSLYGKWDSVSDFNQTYSFFMSACKLYTSNVRNCWCPRVMEWHTSWIWQRACHQSLVFGVALQVRSCSPVVAYKPGYSTWVGDSEGAYSSFSSACAVIGEFDVVLQRPVSHMNCAENGARSNSVVSRCPQTSNRPCRSSQDAALVANLWAASMATTWFERGFPVT